MLHDISEMKPTTMLIEKQEGSSGGYSISKVHNEIHQLANKILSECDRSETKKIANLVCSLSESFLCENSSRDRTQQIESVFYSIQHITDDREAIIGLAKGLVTKGMGSSDVHNILEGINALDKDDREAIAGLAKGLLTEGMGGYSVRYILEGINALDKDDREAIAGLAKGLLTEGMGGNSVRDILEEISALDKDDREAIVGLAKGLVTKGMDGNSVCEILEEISALDKDDREAIVGLAKGLVTKGMDGLQSAIFLKRLML